MVLNIEYLRVNSNGWIERSLTNHDADSLTIDTKLLDLSNGIMHADFAHVVICASQLIMGERSVIQFEETLTINATQSIKING